MKLRNGAERGEPEMIDGRRVVYFTSGLALLAIGILGLVLPLLPTTPFLLFASVCFAKSSPRMHQWMRRNRITGPVLRDWEEKRAVRPWIKVLAIAMVAAVIAVAILREGAWVLRGAVIALGAAGIGVVLWLPTVGGKAAKGNIRG